MLISQTQIQSFYNFPIPAY